MLAKLLEEYFDRLWPINRSLTGNGNRQTLKILSEVIPVNIHEVPSGTKCFDWTIPPEWNVNEAWIANSHGTKIIDFNNNNLHLLGYSQPFKGTITFDELKNHLYTLPEQPELIPYLTSYYKERWGFCLSHNQFLSLKNEEYDVYIDATLDKNGSLTYGDLVVPGQSDQEVMFSTYVCHPSLANNELSGPLVTAFIYNQLKDKNLKYTYRFVYLPETIGSIYYLSKHGDHLKNKLIAGFVVTTIGDNGGFTFKKSRQKNSLTDRATLLLLNQTEKSFRVEEFNPADGSDERQYCSPGFNLPFGALMRTMYGKYPEYHTSADNKSLMDFHSMEKSVMKFLELIGIIENNRVYINTMPFCEPQLGKRGLYPTLGSQKTMAEESQAIFWLLNLADGTRDLIQIAEESKIDFKVLNLVAIKLLESGLIKEKE